MDSCGAPDYSTAFLRFFRDHYQLASRNCGCCFYPISACAVENEPRGIIIGDEASAAAQKKST
jgi:hypothetical protein